MILNRLNPFVSFVLSALMSVSSLAAEPVSERALVPPGAGGFPKEIRSGEVGLGRSTVDRLSRSVIKLKDSAKDSYCTAFAVTPDGYFLTALHCLRSCLLANQAAQEANNLYLGLRDLVVVPQNKSLNVVCDNLSIDAPEVSGPVTIVATGPSLAIYDSRFTSDFGGLYQELKGRGWHRPSNDFALLKAQTTRKLRCLPLRPSSPSASEKIWAVGFPFVEGLESVLSASPGLAYANPRESVFFKSQDSEIGRNWVNEQYATRAVLFSSASNTFGQSGGPVIDRAGRIVGIVTGFASTRVPNTEGGGKREVHELVASPTAWFLRGFDAGLSRELIEKNADCPR